MRILADQPVSSDDLQGVIERLGPFGGITALALSAPCIASVQCAIAPGRVIGLTCRVGRAVFGTVAMVRDLLDTGESLLLLGRPGVGKTTALREIARVLADDLGRRVMVIDTSNEIAGDGDIRIPPLAGPASAGGPAAAAAPRDDRGG